MLALTWRYRWACVLSLLLQVALVAMTVSGLGLTGLGIDFLRSRVDSAHRPPAWPFGLQPPGHWSPSFTLGVIAGAFLAVALLSAGLRYVAALAAAGLSQRILIHLRTAVYEKLQWLSFQFYDANPSSSIINRAAGDVQAVRTFVDGVLIKLLAVGLTLLVYLAYMLRIHVPLTAACLITTPLLWWGAVAFSRRIQPAYRRATELGDRMVLTLVENVHGAHVVKGFAREADQIAKFRTDNCQIRGHKRTIFRRLSTYQPLMGLLTQLNMLVLLGYGGHLVIRGELPLGTGLFVMANLLSEFANQVAQIANIANTIQASLTGAERVFEVLDAPQQVVSRPDAVRRRRARGAVRFDGVAFAYQAGEPVLEAIRFQVQPGQCVGIVGETGAGKSTLLSLIARFYDVAEGAVSVDGVDVRQWHLDDLRRNIGIVFQESFLFSNTVAANIAFGRPDAGAAAIERAARLAAAHDFIRALPAGYETIVGEYGASLSGGQRQRLAIARALLLDPPILILDDATSAVDPETEQEIRAAIATAQQGRTTFLVSNRMSTLQQTDCIMVLRAGRLTHAGTHAELLRASSYYRCLAELQLADGDDKTRSSAPPNGLPALAA